MVLEIGNIVVDGDVEPLCCVILVEPWKAKKHVEEDTRSGQSLMVSTASIAHPRASQCTTNFPLKSSVQNRGHILAAT
jgi:hypothetical protein